MKYLFTIFFIVSFHFIFSQSYQWAISDTTYQSSNGVNIALGNAGEIAVVETLGDTKSIDVVKYDASQNVLWRKRIYSFYLGTSHVAMDNQGNVYYTSGFITYINVDGTQYNGGGGMILVKFNSQGVVQWVKKTTGDVGSSGLAVDEQSSIYIVGGVGPGGTAILDTFTINPGFFIAKCSTNGVVQWVRSTSNGDGSSGFGMGIKVSKSSHIYIGGSLYVPTSFGTHSVSNSGSLDTYIAKIDTSGNWLWAKTGGGIEQDAFYGMDVDNNDNVYITGFYGSPTATFGAVSFSNTSNEDYFLAKYDSNGNVQWATHGVKEGYYANSFCVDSAGNSYMRPHNKFILKHDPNGVPVWSEIKNASNVRMVSDKKGSVYVTGWLSSPTVFGGTTITPVKSQQMYIAKLFDPAPVTTGIKETTDQSLFQVFPNPANQYVTIYTSDVSKGVLKISNSLGQLVHAEVLSNNADLSKKINVSHLAKGLYVIELTNTSHNSRKAQKLIIE